MGAYTELGAEKANFLRMLKKQPNFFKYAFNESEPSSNIKIIKKMWKSSVYGGSVMESVGQGGKGSERTRDNVICDQISLYQIEQALGGGYYVLENLRVQDAENIA